MTTAWVAVGMQPRRASAWPMAPRAPVGRTAPGGTTRPGGRGAKRGRHRRGDPNGGGHRRRAAAGAAEARGSRSGLGGAGATRGAPKRGAQRRRWRGERRREARRGGGGHRGDRLGARAPRQEALGRGGRRSAVSAAIGAGGAAGGDRLGAGGRRRRHHRRTAAVGHLAAHHEALGRHRGRRGLRLALVEDLLDRRDGLVVLQRRRVALDVVAERDELGDHCFVVQTRCREPSAPWRFHGRASSTWQ